MTGGSDCAPPDCCEETGAVTWLHILLTKLEPVSTILSDLELVCETTCHLQSHRIASDWEVRQPPSLIRQYADGWPVVWSFVCTHFGPATTRSQKCN